MRIVATTGPAVQVVSACLVMVALGTLMLVAWGGRRYIEIAERPETKPSWTSVQRYVRGVTMAAFAGFIAGITIGGPGARLAMRLVAVTGPSSSEGRLTEAQETVGRVSVDGTLAIIVFVGIGFSLIAALLYVLVRRWLPAGRAGGLAFGGLLLLVPAIAIDPLRAGNPDFRLVGPGWLALIVFGALVVATGALIAAIVGRLSAALPALDRSRRSLFYAPALIVILPTIAGAFAVIVTGVVVAVGARIPPVIAVVRSRATDLGGRIALGVVAAASLPFFVDTAIDILRSP